MHYDITFNGYHHPITRKTMRKIPLTQGRVALIDDGDFEMLSQFKWHITTRGYAARGMYKDRKMNKIFMHRVIANTPDGMYTDHINGDKLDNRRTNLRICTHVQNMRNQKRRSDNKSGMKGVYWSDASKKWMAYIYKDGKQIYLGLHKSMKKAALAYNKASKKHHGDYSLINTL